MYSIAVAMYSIGQILGSILMLFTQYLGTYSLLIITALCHVVGYVVYGLASNGPAIIIARLLIGCLGAGEALAMSYIGSSVKEYKAISEANNKPYDNYLSKKLIAIYSLVAGASFTVYFGMYNYIFVVLFIHVNF